MTKHDNLTLDAAACQESLNVPRAHTQMTFALRRGETVGGQVPTCDPALDRSRRDARALSRLSYGQPSA